MVDVQRQLDAVEREVVTEEVDGFASRVQNLAQVYPSPIDDVWDAVTSPDRIARWFLPVSGDLRLGGRYQLEGNAGGDVQECAPPAGDAAHFKVTWEYGGGISWVTVRLSAQGDDETRLELEHVAHVDDVPEALWEQFGPSATGIGWDSGLLGLALHLTDPAARPEDPMAWMLSDEGKAFSRGSADAWARAHHADGASAEVAHAAADRTYAMYAGESMEGMPEA
jgi:hypothetical protein